MKIALYKLPHGSITPYEVYYSGEAERCPEGWARMSNIINVEFPPLDDQEVIERQLKAIDEEERIIRNDFQRRLDEFKERRANLQALTHVEA